MKKPIDRYAMMRLNWIKILEEAIQNRPTSWHHASVREWRNASNEICFGVIREMEEKKLIAPFPFLPGDLIIGEDAWFCHTATIVFPKKKKK